MFDFCGDLVVVFNEGASKQIGTNYNPNVIPLDDIYTGKKVLKKVLLVLPELIYY